VPRVLNLAMIAALSFGGAFAIAAPAAKAAVQDGNWSVLIVTEKGGCDKAYRYNVHVSSGLVRYQGDASVNFNGTVAPNGAVRVSIRLGEQGANGTGRLSATAGKGTWRGIGSSGACAGRWEAERR
jgi:hypothetical protein